jgi:hypothetical protein
MAKAHLIASSYPFDIFKLGWSLTKGGIFMWIGHPRCPPLQDKFIIRFYEETIPYLKL